MKRDTQYQDELVQEWAAHLEYLQLILLEFDAEWASAKGTMICYFRKGLKPSVRAKMEQRGQKLDSFEELVQKAVDAEAKAALWPRFYICNTNQYCLWGSRPAPIFATPISIASGVAAPLILLLPKFHPKVTK